MINELLIGAARAFDAPESRALPALRPCPGFCFTMQATKGEIFEVRSDLIKWVEDKPIKVRKQAKLVILNLAIASREPDPGLAFVTLLADQVEQLAALMADKRWHRR